MMDVFSLLVTAMSRPREHNNNTGGYLDLIKSKSHQQRRAIPIPRGEKTSFTRCVGSITTTLP